MKRLVALGALMVVAACDDGYEQAGRDLTQSTRELNEANEMAAAIRGDVEPQPVSLSDADKGRVCRAIIASLNGRDPAIIEVISSQGFTHRVRYRRDDGTVWTNECRVGSGTAEWRAITDGQPGRWRDEDTIRFTVDGPTITVETFSMGELMTNDTYTVE